MKKNNQKKENDDKNKNENKRIGHSVYLSSSSKFSSKSLNKTKQSFVFSWKDCLQELASLPSTYVKDKFCFISLHWAEEAKNFSKQEYQTQTKQMCLALASLGLKVVADVSCHTLSYFSYKSLHQLAVDLKLFALRPDYGISEKEIIGLAKEMPLCLNASTITKDFLQVLLEQLKQETKNHKEKIDQEKKIVKKKKNHKKSTKEKPCVNIFALHNFYPRPETALDAEYFQEKNKILQKANIPVWAFIGLPQNSKNLRSPIFAGLPTLEEHRNISCYAAYVDMRLAHAIDGVLLGDYVFDKQTLEKISRFEQEDIIELTVSFDESFGSDWYFLYNKTFTIREDSPKFLKRIKESREYANEGKKVLSKNCFVRQAGSITVDNENYARYSGEMQILLKDFPADSRVNVIGKIDEQEKILLKHITNGKQIRIVKK